MPVTRRSTRGRTSQPFTAGTGLPETPTTATTSSSSKTSVIGETDTPATSDGEEYESKVAIKMKTTTLRRSARHSVAVSIEVKKEDDSKDIEVAPLKRKASDVFVDIITKKIESTVPQAKKVRFSSCSRVNCVLTHR